MSYIHYDHGIPTRNQQLFFNGKKLHKMKPMVNSGISDGAIINLNIEMGGLVLSLLLYFYCQTPEVPINVILSLLWGGGKRGQKAMKTGDEDEEETNTKNNMPKQ